MTSLSDANNKKRQRWGQYRIYWLKILCIWVHRNFLVICAVLYYIQISLYYQLLFLPYNWLYFYFLFFSKEKKKEQICICWIVIFSKNFILIKKKIPIYSERNICWWKHFIFFFFFVEFSVIFSFELNKNKLTVIAHL